MYILAADTSTSVNTVAVCKGEQLLAETIVDCGKKHSERLLVTVDWILGEAGLTLDDITALAISIGPGAFTGLRVGASTWKGLAFAKRLPLVAVPTLDAMTRLSVFRNCVVCPLIDAKMGEVFGAAYAFENGIRTKITEARVCAVELIFEGLPDEVIVLGDGGVRYRDRITAAVKRAVFAPHRCSIPRASAVAAEALSLLERGAATDAADVSPVYLRKAKAVELPQRVARE